MPKLPRDISGRELAKLLKKYRYQTVRQAGSHMRLVSNFKDIEHKITIPDHKPIKIGTLNNILIEVSDYLKITKEELVEELFKKKGG
ncbi:MAG: type II toxin-antitoxin system HicA family toxin [Deltaproteobacteria bacterium]|nr:type II toxin-antitoxin system HicA family toxin [Deltaproteobacteria bacterium]